MEFADPNPKLRLGAAEVVANVDEPKERPVDVEAGVIPKFNGAVKDVGIILEADVVVPNPKPVPGADVVGWAPVMEYNYYN